MISDNIPVISIRIPNNFNIMLDPMISHELSVIYRPMPMNRAIINIIPNSVRYLKLALSTSVSFITRLAISENKYSESANLLYINKATDTTVISMKIVYMSVVI